MSLSGCGGSKSVSAVAKAPSAAPVETRAAIRGVAVRAITATGSLVSLQDVTLSSRIAGRLAVVSVREGDSVAAGQVVALLDTSDQESQVQAAEGAVAAAKARVAQAEAAYRQQKTSSRSVVHAAEAAYGQQRVSTQAGIESAASALAAARAQLSQVREGARGQDIRRAESQVAVARASSNNAQADLRRYQQLAKDGAVSQSSLDKFVTAGEVAREQLRAAEEGLSLVKEGARSQEVTQAEQVVRQAEERLRQARAAAAMDQVRQADVETARAALAQNDVRRAEILAARAALQQALGSLAIARKALADSAIRTPIAGQVAARHAEPGQTVSPGAPLLQVVALDSVFFEPSVPDRELEFVRIGQPVQVTANGVPGRTFVGRVTKIYPSGSSQSRSVPIRITLANPDQALRPQMFAQGRIETARHARAVLVPKDSLVRNDGGSSSEAKVFIETGGVARERAVSVGLPSADGSLVEVTGIPDGARVIAAGQGNLSDGDRVTAAPSTR
jgi:RND family efflux transporter MFP subunit